LTRIRHQAGWIDVSAVSEVAHEEDRPVAVGSASHPLEMWSDDRADRARASVETFDIIDDGDRWPGLGTTRGPRGIHV
jgi:urease beta subunit